ncbi:MAG TPA: hypothetical protein VFS21_33265 [Roseiflexaceae bacterium]|nr:hypothetical protein [Roseiflexaceae bacterium]
MAEPYNPYRPIRSPRPVTAGRRMGQSGTPHPPRAAGDEELFDETPAAPPAPASKRPATLQEAQARLCARYLPRLAVMVLGGPLPPLTTIEECYDLAERLLPMMEQPALAAPQVAVWLAEALRPVEE